MTTQPTRRKARTPIPLDVLRTERTTPNMIRVVFGGDGLAHYRHNEFTDRYVKLAFPPPGVTYAEPLDLEAVRRDHPVEQRPRMRTYTVRCYDPDLGELTIDFVYHGDRGLAGPWAAQARPGDRLHVLGPGGAYAPDPTADWHLLIGDEAALPAIAAAIAELPGDATILGVIELGGLDDATYLDAPHRADIHWLCRDRNDPGLVEAVEPLSFPAGEPHAFVHGELQTIQRLRTHLTKQRNIPRERLSISGYWRRGKDEDGFQAEKSKDARPERACAG